MSDALATLFVFVPLSVVTRNPLMFACGPEVDACQVAHGVVVFHMIQSAHHHAPRVTGVGAG